MRNATPPNLTEKEIEDFTVLPSSDEVALPIFEMFERLIKGVRRKDLLKRMPSDGSETDYFLRAAIDSIEMTSALFRKNTNADILLTSSWLSLTKEKARMTIVEGAVSSYSDLSLDDLRGIAMLSVQPKQLYKLSDILAQKYGIILVLEQAFPGMKTDGCAYKLRNGTPVVGLSLRYNRYDYFWFTLMHELSHIALHYERLDTPIIDDLDEDVEEEVEAEANRTAADSLVPRNIWRKLLLHRNSLEHLIGFSKEAGIHSAITAGMLRRYSKNYAIFSELVSSIDTKKELRLLNA